MSWPMWSEVREGCFYGSEGVKIRGAAVAGPRPAAAVCGVVGMEDLQACGEGEVFQNLAEAPAGDLCESVDIRAEPVGAV